MKTLLSFAVLVLGLCPCAYADYYRATGGGVYELYVDDCTPVAMRRALDMATAARHAVITSVKCAAPRNKNANINVAPVAPDADMETIPAEYLCPCVVARPLYGC